MMGFCAPEDRNVAVCVLPGTELSFANAARRSGLWPWNKNITNHKTAIFRQINQHDRWLRRQANRYNNGK